MRSYQRHLIISFVLFLAACAPPPLRSQSELGMVTPSKTLTMIPSPTIMWFPPTATATAAALIEPLPTLQAKPDLGDPIFVDDFSVPQGWDTLHNTTGSVAYGKNELVVAVAAPKGMLVSMNSEPLPEKFYLEIDARTALCRSGDSYGILLRAAEMNEYVRFTVACNGPLLVEWVRQGINQSTQSVNAPPDSMMGLRLGVMVTAREMRFFINDANQFSLLGVRWKGGHVGVVTRAGAKTAVTISFSNLAIYEIGAVPPTPTPVPSATITVVPAAEKKRKPPQSSLPDDNDGRTKIAQLPFSGMAQ